MKIKRSLLFVIPITILLILITVGLYFGYSRMNSAWIDTKTWTTEEKVIIPAQTENLKIKNTVVDSADSKIKKFSFTADYCYLYEIAKAADEQTATIRCSLLPMYYVERAKELPNDWQAKSDILLVISKNDSEPDEFLGRQLKTFESVSNLGSSKYPVSIAIEGQYTYPAESFVAKVNHLLKVINGGKEKLNAEISNYSIKRLDNATPVEMHEFSKEWVKNMNKTLSDRIVTSKLDKLSGQDFLDGANNLFKYQRVKCLGLNSCEYSYIGNPANIYAYMLYSAETLNRDFFKHATKAMAEKLYPFDGTSDYTLTDEDVVDGKIMHWKVFSAYYFPLCPVNDLVSVKKSESFGLLEKYLTKEVVLENNLLNKKALLNLLSSSEYTYEGLQKSLVDFGGWETNKIFAVNEGCVRSLDGNDEETLALRKKVLETYFAMLSLFVGTKTDGSTESLERIIYESNAYSPYSSQFISDFGIARYREQDLESNEVAAGKYIEWRSVLSSYVITYLYEAKK